MTHIRVHPKADARFAPAFGMPAWLVRLHDLEPEHAPWVVHPALAWQSIEPEALRHLNHRSFHRSQAIDIDSLLRFMEATIGTRWQRDFIDDAHIRRNLMQALHDAIRWGDWVLLGPVSPNEMLVDWVDEPDFQEGGYWQANDAGKRAWVGHLLNSRLRSAYQERARMQRSRKGMTARAIASPVIAATSLRPAPQSRAAIQEGFPKGCDYLDHNQGSVLASSYDFNSKRKPFTLSDGTPIEQKFPGASVMAATRYDMKLGEKSVPIIVANALPSKGVTPSAQQIAKSISALSEKRMQEIDRVLVSATSNPDDAYWQKLYNRPTFFSAASASKSDGITFFPWLNWTGDVLQGPVDSAVIHEAAHIYSDVLWEKPLMKKEWEAAIAADPFPPSRYASYNANEDFAETSVMYHLSKGGPCEATARQRYPARYQYLDDLE